jgi:hypothetical protein
MAGMLGHPSGSPALLSLFILAVPLCQLHKVQCIVEYNVHYILNGDEWERKRDDSGEWIS